jgi:hypothetical protein
VKSSHRAICPSGTATVAVLSPEMRCALKSRKSAFNSVVGSQGHRCKSVITLTDLTIKQSNKLSFVAARDQIFAWARKLRGGAESSGTGNRTANEIIAAMSGDDRRPKKENAEMFLRGALAGGRQTVPDIEGEARAAGLLGENQRITNCKPLRNAADRLGIVSAREGFGRGAVYYWSLPCLPDDTMRAHARPRSEGAHMGTHDGGDAAATWLRNDKAGET